MRSEELKNILDHTLLGPVEMRVLIAERNRPRSGKHGLSLVPSIADALNNLLLGRNRLCGCELTGRRAPRVLDNLKFSGREPGVEIAAHLTVSDLSHTAAQAVTDQCTFIHNGFALEIFVTREGKR